MLNIFRKLAWLDRDPQEWFDSLTINAQGPVTRNVLERNVDWEDGIDFNDLFAWLDANGDGVVCKNDFDVMVSSPIFSEQFSSLTSQCSFSHFMARNIPTDKRVQGAWGTFVEISDSDMEAYALAAFPAFLKEMKTLRETLRSCKNPASVSAGSKFSFSPGAQEFLFGNLEMFKTGLDRLIGLPALDMEEAMKGEHSSLKRFITSNYGINTFPKQEFDLVDKAQIVDYLFAQGRRVCNVDDLLLHPKSKKAGLSRAEVVALVLYTGPMFQLYNEEMRLTLFPLAKQALSGNQVELSGMKLPAYLTTIHMIVSGILKLSGLTDLKDGEAVYRGVGGRVLPKQFRDMDETGCRGGTDLAFMSTTRDINVALSYAGKSRWPTVFRIEMGQVDRGADLEFLSQYSNEREVLFPPLCHYQVVGEPEYAFIQGRSFFMVAVRLNVNLRSSTKEQHESRRRLEYVGTSRNLLLEIQRSLELAAQSDASQRKLQQMPSHYGNDAQKMKAWLVDECSKIVNGYGVRDAAWFNSDNNLQSSFRETVRLKQIALNLFSKFERDRVNTAEFFSQYSLLMWHRVDVGDSRREYERALASESGSEQALRAAALKYVVAQGLAEPESLEESSGMDHETVLMRAAADGHVERITLLFHAGCDVNLYNERFCTALRAAVIVGHSEAVRQLLVCNADKELRHSHAEETPLMTAVSLNRTSCMDELVAAGCNLTAQTSDGQSAIHIAGSKGYLEMVSKLVALGASARSRDGTGRQCIHYAANSGHSELVMAMLDGQLADVQDACDRGRTALHWAVHGGHVDVCRQLVQDKHADVSLQDSKGLQLVHIAASMGRLQCMLFVIDAFGASPKAKQAEHPYEEPIHFAAKRGELACVEALATKFGVDVSARNGDAECPIHLAAKNGHGPVVRALVRMRAEVSLVSDSGLQPIHLAAWGGCIEAVKCLHEAGADVNACDPAGNQAVHLAAKGGSATCLRLMVLEMLADVRAQRCDGQEPIHLAVRFGNVDCVKVLVEELGAGVEAADPKQTRPLHLAAAFDHFEIMQQLIVKHCADLSAMDENGYSAIHWAALKGSAKCIKLLTEHGAVVSLPAKNGAQPVHLAARAGSLEKIRLLVEQRADINATTNDGEKPVHAIAKMGAVEMMRVLVTEMGADPRAKRKDGSEALHLAVKYGHVEFVQALVTEHGVDPHAKGPDGDPPLHIALQAENPNPMIETLVSGLGADILALDSDGFSAIHRAAQWRQPSCVRVFVSLGADPSVPSEANEHKQPIHLAAYEGCSQTVKCLLEMKANIDAGDVAGNRAVHYAALGNEAECLRLLVTDMNADPRVQRDDGQTPLQLAMEDDHVECVAVLKSISALDLGSSGGTSMTEDAQPLPEAGSTLSLEPRAVGAVVDQGNLEAVPTQLASTGPSEEPLGSDQSRGPGGGGACVRPLPVQHDALAGSPYLAKTVTSTRLRPLPAPLAGSPNHRRTVVRNSVSSDPTPDLRHRVRHRANASFSTPPHPTSSSPTSLSPPPPPTFPALHPSLVP